jgi:methyl-accepting chemotaxis protein
VNIRNRLLVGFLLVIVISATMGVYAITMIGRMSTMTSELYDHSLMASNFALSATSDFERLDRTLTVTALSDGGAGLRDAAKSIGAIHTTVLDDLGVVRERFPGTRGIQMVDELKKLLADWDSETKRIVEASPADLPKLLTAKDKLRNTIDAKLDILVEAAKEEGLNFRQEAADVSDFSYQMLLVAVGVTIAFGIAISLLIARSIARPIIAITGTMSRLAAGDTTVSIPALARRDEVGRIAKAVEVFQQQAIDGMRHAETRMEEQAIKERRSESMARLTTSFDAQVSDVIENVAAAASKLTATSQGVASVAAETSQKATTVAAASEEASVSVQTVAAATEELATSINEISRQVAQSTQIAEKAVMQAGRTNVTVGGLTDAARQIGDVVHLIQDIAAQTNLLALNATIEAARAGDAGKGFAVVASEVKVLAAQTAKATEEISKQVDAIRSATGSAAEAIREIGGTIGELSEIGSSIASAVDQQGSATREIALNVQQAANGTGDVAINISGVMAASEISKHSASEVLGSASALSEQAEILRHQVQAFLKNIRAA